MPKDTKYPKLQNIQSYQISKVTTCPKIQNVQNYKMSKVTKYPKFSKIVKMIKFIIIK